MARLVSSLEAFLKRDAAMSWEPGRVDCCMFLASWAMWIGHPDPARHLRGMYDSEDGFRTIVAAAGGIVPVVAECVTMIAGHEVCAPMRGVIGVIGSAANINRQWGAIFDGQHWLVRSKAGVLSFSASPLAMWKI